MQRCEEDIRLEPSQWSVSNAEEERGAASARSDVPDVSIDVPNARDLPRYFAKV